MRDYSFGNLITRLREAHGYSQFQLGKLVGVTGKAVSKWENGTAKPRIDTCVHLAEILEISLDVMLSVRGADPAPGKKESLIQKRRANRMEREDTYKKKHIELHVRTGYSPTEGFGLPEDYLKRADSWGQPALAITDFCVTRGFPRMVNPFGRYHVKRILGCEILMIPDHEEDPEKAVPIMVLVRNREGLLHLNQLLTDCFLSSGENTVRISQRVISENRIGLLLGSSCNNGEIIRGIRNGLSEEDLRSLASFYDYLEIQPVENTIKAPQNEIERRSEEEERSGIIRIGDTASVPVVAVGNVCFPDPENSLDDAVLRYNRGETMPERAASRYLRTTDEMIRAFSFLDAKTCHRVIVDAPQEISDLIEDHISLIPEDSKEYWGAFPGTPEDYAVIAETAEKRALELYGNPLPSVVDARLKEELDTESVQKGSFTFSLARELVRLSEEKGYTVGERGCICSSFVAMLCGISDFSPLPPHYLCPECRFSDFEVDALQYRCGPDLPDRTCPRCGTVLKKEGYQLPPQTLFGFRGDRSVDIDLNFAWEIQGEIHESVRNLFGPDRVCYAGVVSGMDPDTSRHCLRRYLADHEMFRTDKEIADRVDSYSSVFHHQSCHPGGVVVAPPGHRLVEYTPLQWVTDEQGKKRIATHYEFYSFHDSLLKMDCLAHTMPSLLHLLEQDTGVDPLSLPLHDEKVFRLFHSTESLGLNESELLCCTGTYGIQEFSAGYVQKILRLIQPKTMEELIRISGWAHGTGVWLENAENRIRENPENFLLCPAARDDIMMDLLHWGFDTETAWSVMETVRKGKGICPKKQQELLSRGVPQIYIDSCLKIRYMFPKAHAVAYILPALRIAWYKVYRPESFYRCWFRQLSDHLKPGDFDIDPKELRRGILELRDFDSFDHWKQYDRMALLQLILEARLRGMELKSIWPGSGSSSFTR